MAQNDRQAIRNVAREHGWSEEQVPPHSVIFTKGNRTIEVTFDPQGHTRPVEAYYGTKRLRSRDLAGDIIGNLRKS